MHEMNDNFIHDYWSIYTTKQMPIQVAQETDVEAITDGQQMLIASLGCSHGFKLHQNIKETKA